jgi:ribonuclease HI
VRGEPQAAAAAPLSEPATNQRAELTALLESLKFAQGANVKIYSDSMYSINCCSVWGPAWKKKGWKRSSGEPLLNLDIIQPLVELYAKKKIPLIHVKGHQTGSSPEAWGNNWVDRAAVEGSIGHIINYGSTVMSVSTVTSVPTAKPVAVTPGDLRNWFK